VYEHNQIVSGPFAGRTLADVVREHGIDIVGTRTFDRYGADFPLLAKFIDAADDLSVQVHPDDTYAHTVEAATGFHGKTEAWYILRADPGAEIIHGFCQPCTREQYAAAIQQGMLDRLLRRIPVSAGDTIFVPAGTIHAIKAGILLFEIQQKSDLTYRVFDYNRRDDQGDSGELHVDKALDVTNCDIAPSPTVAPERLDADHDLLVQCPYFLMERWMLEQPRELATASSSFEIWTAIEGAAQLNYADGSTEIQRGDSVVLPAALGSYTLQRVESVTLLRCYVP
jgi:mannose-6-phosphate isomerase